jgi:hypothetical protein
MIRSKAMSEIIVGMKLSTLDSVLIGSQTFCPGTRIERSYESDKPSASIIFEIGHSPVRHLFTKTIVVRVPWDSSSSKGKVKGKGLLWMWNAALIPHTVIASVTTTLFLFQIAMLAISMST